MLTLEASDKKHDVKADAAHYAEIAVPVSTSVPQIRRDFTERFSNGRRYLAAAGRKFEQPTHHARKIMLLADLCSDAVLDRFIGYSIDQDKMDIASFKGLLRDFNAGKLALPEPESPEADMCNRMAIGEEDPALTRDCSYYETNGMTEARI